MSACPRHLASDLDVLRAGCIASMVPGRGSVFYLGNVINCGCCICALQGLESLESLDTEARREAMAGQIGSRELRDLARWATRLEMVTSI